MSNPDKSKRWVKYRVVKRAVDRHMIPCDTYEPKLFKEDNLGEVNDSGCSHAYEPSGTHAVCYDDASPNEGASRHVNNINKGECESQAVCEFGVTSNFDDFGMCIDEFELQKPDVHGHLLHSISDCSMTNDSCCSIPLEPNCETVAYDASNGQYGDNCLNEDSVHLQNEIAVWALNYNITHSSLSDLLKILSKYHTMPLDPRTLLKTKNVHQILPMKDMMNGCGEYVYFGIERQIQKNMADLVLHNNLDKLDLLFNVDGLPLFRSSSKQFWPILCAASVLGRITKPFAVAVFCGNSKPVSADVFLYDFARELTELQKIGMVLNGNSLRICVKGFICDAPARAFVKCIKGHTGYYGCEKCCDKGHYVNNRLTFQRLDAPKRCDLSFASQAQEEHHKGVSPLLAAEVGLVSQVPLEYMHLICLGVVRKLLLHWLRGGHHVRISMQTASRISDEIVQLQPFMCREFHRKPRPLSDVDRWKAVEFRQFLCYIGPLVLRNHLSSEIYHHFMLLHVAVVMLLDPANVTERCDSADQMLREFVKQLPVLYGKDSLVYTMHNLVHLVDDVRRFGALDSFSAFAFENELGQLKKLLRNGKKPLKQLCRRMAEQEVAIVTSSSIINDVTPTLKYVHCDGPTNGIHGTQYKMLSYLGNTFVVGKQSYSDSYALLKSGKVVKVENFIQADEIIVIGQILTRMESFYTYPCDSKFINIFKLTSMHGDRCTFCWKEIIRKCMIFPRKEYFVCIPLLHAL